MDTSPPESGHATEEDELFEAFLLQMRTEIGDEMPDAVIGDPCREELRLAIHAATSRDGVAEGLWQELKKRSETKDGRGRITSAKLVLDMLPLCSPLGELMAIASARMCTLIDGSARENPEQPRTAVRSWSAKWKRRAGRILRSTERTTQYMEAMARQGEPALENMAGNEQARQWLMNLLMLDAWDPSVALSRLQEALSQSEKELYITDTSEQ